MKRENEEIAEKNAQLRKRLEQEKKEREALEQHLSKIQEEQGAAVIDLHKHLSKHVKDMHTWKDFLEQDKDYDSVDLHIHMADDLKNESFVQKVDIIEGAFNEETTTLQRLLQERNSGKKADREMISSKKKGKK